MIIIPDIHGRDFWKKPVEENIGKEHIIFLGDYLDQYDYEQIDSCEVFPRFEEIISIKRDNPNSVTLLLGNHDLHYVNGDLLGGRYDYLHALRNRKSIVDNAELFQLAHEVELSGQKYLFTHAGVVRGWFEKYKAYLGGIKPEDIGKQLNKYWRNRGYWPRLFSILADVSFSRWGDCEWGSPIWSDATDMNLSDYEVRGIYQIFGHSQQVSEPVIGDYFACLDCRKAFRMTDKGEIISYDH